MLRGRGFFSAHGEYVAVVPIRIDDETTIGVNQPVDNTKYRLPLRKAWFRFGKLALAGSDYAKRCIERYYSKTPPPPPPVPTGTQTTSTIAEITVRPAELKQPGASVLHMLDGSYVVDIPGEKTRVYRTEAGMLGYLDKMGITDLPEITVEEPSEE